MNILVHLPIRLVRCRIFLVFLNIARCGFAEDPIIVHYSDPSLARMEAQIGITPAQKDRFEDIVVKYRDLQSNTDADSYTQGTARTGRPGGGRGSIQGQAEGDTRGPFERAEAKVSREELDELATILTPAQIKKFQNLNGTKGKKRHAS